MYEILNLDVFCYKDKKAGLLRATGFWPRSLCEVEMRLDATRKDCLAVLQAILLVRPYPEGTRFVFRTDYASLSWIFNLKEPTGHLARWRLRFMEFDFEVFHSFGAHHQAPYAMFCLATVSVRERKEIEADIDDDIPTYCFLGHVSDVENILQKKKDQLYYTPPPPLNYAPFIRRMRFVNTRTNVLGLIPALQLMSKD